MFRDRRATLLVDAEPNRSSYVPREQVELKITTKTPEEKPVPAKLALSVVDGTALSFADDKRGHILS